MKVKDILYAIPKYNDGSGYNVDFHDEALTKARKHDKIWLFDFKSDKQVISEALLNAEVISLDAYSEDSVLQVYVKFND